MRALTRMVLSVLLLGGGLAASFAAGQSKGFTQGSEWALMQAELVAREAGVFMPVSYEDGDFHVVIRQPRLLSREARRLAAIHAEDGQLKLENDELASEEALPDGKEQL